MDKLSFSFSSLAVRPLVSCIVISFNNAPFLSEAIESILAQTYKHWELWLVDDGSTDGSAQIAQQYAQQYPQQVHYLEHPHHQNQGKNASRNLGIQNAQGELIALLDGDDVWLLHKLAEQVAVFQQYPDVAMVYGRSQFWYSWTGQPADQDRDCFFPNLGAPPNTLVQPPHLALDLLEGNSQTPTTCNAIWRREVIDQVGDFDETYHEVFEDKLFFIKVALYFPIFVADNYWANYRKRADSSYLQFVAATQAQPTLMPAVQLKFLHWVETYLISQHYADVDVWQYLRQRQRQQFKVQWFQRLHVYAAWRNILAILLSFGRQALPKSWRDWLWRAVGQKLYVE